jgi:hypothetical protein
MTPSLSFAMNERAAAPTFGDGDELAGRIGRTDLERLVDAETFERLAAEAQVFDLLRGVPALTFNRLDVAMKASFMETMANPGALYDARVYDEHIKVFSHGSYVEDNSSHKIHIGQYRNDCAYIYDFVSEGRFDPGKSLIPVARDGSLINGAHRAAASVLSGQPVWMVQTHLPPRPYDYRFFLRKGMRADLVANTAVRYIERARHCSLALVWLPAEQLARQIASVFPRKLFATTLGLSRNGVDNLLGQLCDPTDRLATARADRSSRRRAVLAVAFQSQPADSCSIALELDARHGLHVEAFHITEGDADALRLARLVLNPSSVHFLNEARPGRFPGANARAALACGELAMRGCDPEHIVVDGDAVLEAYGLREARGVDCVYVDPSDGVAAANSSDLECHGVDKIELVRDPQNYFHYNDMRFVSLSQLSRVKARRSLEQDLRDLRLIWPLITKQRGTFAQLRAAAYARFTWSRLRNSASKGVWRFILKIADEVGFGDRARLLKHAWGSRAARR